MTVESVPEGPGTTIPPQSSPPLTSALIAYYLTSLIAILGVVFGRAYITPRGRGVAEPGDLLGAFANWDGRWYLAILETGYDHDPAKHSNVAFFPAFPLLAAALARLTGLRGELALLLTAHACLAAAFVVLAAYVRRRCGPDSTRLAPWVLLAFGLWPTSCFARFAYSEGLFLLLTLLTLHGVAARWPAPALAALVGLATATRPVGVALLLPLLLHLRDTAPGWPAACRRLLVLLPLALWGLLAFMAYQWVEFGEPLAFARTQQHWRVRPAAPLGERVVSLLTLEPLWSVLVPSSECYWLRHEPSGNPLFSLHLANPLFFVVTAALLVVGARAGWLNRGEVWLGAALLLIPYLTRGHEMCLGSMGRFAAAVVPAYVVLGHLLMRITAPAAALALSLSAALLGAYSALFAAWHRVF